MSGTSLTDIQIANQALAACGSRGEISSFSDKSVEARFCTMYYADTRDALLRAAHWNFSRRLVPLTLLLATPGTPQNPTIGTEFWTPGQQPQPPWMYEYAYPSDCLLARYISPQISQGQVGGVPIFSAPSWIPQAGLQLMPQRFLAAYDADLAAGPQRVLLCDQPNALGIYTARIESPSLWDPSFKSAMVAALAKRLNIPVGGNSKLIPDLNREAATAIMQARVSDGNEGLTFVADTQRPPDWITVRGYAGDWAGTSYYSMMWQNPGFLVL